jgi:hypothetical protein
MLTRDILENRKDDRFFQYSNPIKRNPIKQILPVELKNQDLFFPIKTLDFFKINDNSISIKW